MAIDVFEMYEELCGSVNTQQGGHVRPNRNFLQWVNAISLSLFEEKFAVWAKSQKIVDDLSKPFLKSVNQQVTDGVAKFPADYAHYSSARYYSAGGDAGGVPGKGLDLYDCCGKLINPEDGCPPFMEKELWEAMRSEAKATEAAKPVKSGAIEIPIDMIGNERWGAVAGHRFAGPTTSSPKMTQYEGGFKVAPPSVKLIVLDYLRMPMPATFEYTVVPGDPITGRGDYMEYDKTKSRPLEWSPLVRNEILTRLDKKYGKYIREDFIWQTAESDRKQTV